MKSSRRRIGQIIGRGTGFLPSPGHAVIPAQAGIALVRGSDDQLRCLKAVPACAGMTMKEWAGP
jgi:hypothetical protein